MRFSLSGNTITVSQVPVPGAIWLFGSALLGFIGLRRRAR
ncbi:MAG: PEP-CTERM sorting domain-containing protein [Methylomonas sp.]|nr:PEP-CTERM sorting domain-containing protein [Methylomonas sp.]